MQLSAQEEYGLRCLVQVARRDQAGPVGLPDIATAEGMSTEHAAKMMRVLRKAGIVESVRGASGGYRLARPAEEITIWEVLTALGKPLFSESFCSNHSGQLSDCVHSTGCTIRSLWSQAGAVLRRLFEAVSLAQLRDGGVVLTPELVAAPPARAPVDGGPVLS